MSQGTNQNTVDEETPKPDFASCCQGMACGTSDFSHAMERMMSACGPMMQRMPPTHDLHTVRTRAAQLACGPEARRGIPSAAWDSVSGGPEHAGAAGVTQADAMTEHRPLVRAFALRHVGDEALADDLTQETFLRAERSRSSYRGEASERSWLCAITLNLIRDHFRAAGRALATTTAPQMLDSASSDEDGEHALLESEMAACVGEFLLQLPQPQHDVLALHDMAGLTHPEIAVSLDISVANSRVLLHRGRSLLREILKQNCTFAFDGDDIPCERKEECS